MNDLFIKYYGSVNHIIYHAIIGVSIIIGLIRFNKLSLTAKILFILLIITPLVELTAYHYYLIVGYNSFIYNPFTIIQCFLLASAYYVETKSLSIVILFSLFILLAIINGIFFEPFLSKGNYHTHMVESLFLITCFFIFITAYFKRTELLKIDSFPLFWVGLAFLIFSIVSIVAFGFSLLVEKNNSWNSFILYTKRYSNYILYASFIPAFLCSQKSLNDFTTGTGK